MFLGAWTPKKLQVSTCHSLVRSMSDRLTPQVALRFPGKSFRRCRMILWFLHTRFHCLRLKCLSRMLGKSSPQTEASSVSFTFKAGARSPRNWLVPQTKPLQVSEDPGVSPTSPPPQETLSSSSSLISADRNQPCLDSREKPPADVMTKTPFK